MKKLISLLLSFIIIITSALISPIISFSKSYNAEYEGTLSTTQGTVLCVCFANI